MAKFKYELEQLVFIASNGHPVAIKGRTEFVGAKQNRYYVTSDDAIPGKNHAEDWINESDLTDVEPVADEPVTKKTAKEITAKRKAQRG